MSETNEFTGLKMPVFTAFGWAGEETAIQFALSQLEMFIQEVHQKAPAAIKDLLSFQGLSKENQNVFMSQTANPEDGLHVVYNARTSSLEMLIGLSNKAALEKTYKQLLKQPVLGHRLITQLGPEWSIWVQQMQFDPESGDSSNYQELFKDGINKFDDETAAAVFEKAAYLNGEEKWVVPLYISRRFDAEQVSAMGEQVVDVMQEQLITISPLLTFLSGKSAKKKATKAKATKSRKTKTTTTTKKSKAKEGSIEDGFTYRSLLKPLHIRRGFVNLTPEHWPFFSINSRTETRPVTVYYDGVYDKGSAVWRMLPDDRARLVLSPTVHSWLEQNFSSDDALQVTATKISSDEIQLTLKAANE